MKLELSAEERLAYRADLYHYFSKRGAEKLLAPKDYGPLDDSLLNARKDGRAFTVCLSLGVEWGPAISHYVECADEFRADDHLMVDVPNCLAGRESELYDLFESWLIDKSDEFLIV